MNNIIIVMFYCILISSCISNLNLRKEICEYDSPLFKITEEQLDFDHSKYDSILSIEGVIILKNSTQTKEIQNNIIGITDNITKLTKWINYYDNGGINSTTFFLRDSSGTEIYKETYYDENGNITKIIDHDKGYNICWAEAIEIVKQVAKKEILKNDVTDFNFQRTDLNEFPNAQPMWRISLIGNEDFNNTYPKKIYWIDGVTGKHVKTTQVIFSDD